MQKIDFNKIQKIHFIGIGGIGLSAIAKLMLMKGKNVSGSDANDSEILTDLRRLGAKIFIGQKAENIARDIDLVIYTLAIPKNSPERLKAEKMAIPAITYPEALGILFNEKFGIAVCGTHGKSTTTSMVSLVLAGAGFDPSVVVGSKVPEFGGNLRIGESDYFIIEACEYERAFLSYYPNIIILNNIELDHTDYYKDMDDFSGAFEEFVGHLPNGGVLILNGDGKEMTNFKCQMTNQAQNPNVKIINFGFGEDNDVRACNIKFKKGKTKFNVKYEGKDLGEFEIKLPGRFNVYNALAAIAAGMYLKIDVERIKKSLIDFNGIWRRFEIKGEYKGAKIISDYAHHPTAVRSTIEAAREFYPGRRIMAVFQPHQHNRTKMLYKDFLKSFDCADVLILAEIFDVAGREEKKDQNVSSKILAEDIKKRIECHSERSEESLANARKSHIRARSFGLCPQYDKSGADKDIDCVLKSDNIFYAKNPDETRELIDEKIKTGDIVLIMGAGDIYIVADDLVK